MAALGGDLEAAAEIGSAYWLGYIVIQDVDLSFFWSKLAAKHGCARAQCDVAEFYMEGMCVPKKRGKSQGMVEKGC